ncbi:hypothetical protein SK128_008084 [Halocaridina rubra]|uniref:Uncharacterized protein n=1 Tax=Halocaridina rubra TaxID=373956 RepID=A0AAN9AFB7_HALRR
MIWEDFLKSNKKFSSFTSEQAKKVTILISIIAGTICTAFGLLAGSIDGLFQISYSIGGAIGGPLGGLILTAILCPWVKSISALVGFLSSISFMMWMVIGNFLYAPGEPMLPLSTEGCQGNNITTITTMTDFTRTTFPSTSTTDGQNPADSEVFPLYLVTYALYGSIGVLTTMFVANVATIIFGATDENEVPKETVSKFSLKVHYWISSFVCKSTAYSKDGGRRIPVEVSSSTKSQTQSNTSENGSVSKNPKSDLYSRKAHAQIEISSSNGYDNSAFEIEKKGDTLALYLETSERINQMLIRLRAD